jgi:hypothetical protein
MPSDSFQIAAERAASSYPTEVWFTISQSERAAAIYRELRKLDAESVGEQRRPPAERPTEEDIAGSSLYNQSAACAR